jgi:prevent-host-death family protein
MMKTMTVFEARNHFSRTLEACKEDVVIVTRNGKPVAAIQAITDEDLEDFLLERSPKFWEMIARARKGKSVSLESVRGRLGAAPRSRGKSGQRRRRK